QPEATDGATGLVTELGRTVAAGKRNASDHIGESATVTVIFPREASRWKRSLRWTAPRSRSTGWAMALLWFWSAVVRSTDPRTPRCLRSLPAGYPSSTTTAEEGGRAVTHRRTPCNERSRTSRQ